MENKYPNYQKYTDYTTGIDGKFSPAEQIAYDIIQDITSRVDYDQEWFNTCDAVKDEIVFDFVQIAQKHLDLNAEPKTGNNNHYGDLLFRPKTETESKKKSKKIKLTIDLQNNSIHIKTKYEKVLLYVNGSNYVVPIVNNYMIFTPPIAMLYGDYVYAYGLKTVENSLKVL